MKITVLQDKDTDKLCLIHTLIRWCFKVNSSGYHSGNKQIKTTEKTTLSPMYIHYVCTCHTRVCNIQTTQRSNQTYWLIHSVHSQVTHFHSQLTTHEHWEIIENSTVNTERDRNLNKFGVWCLIALTGYSIIYCLCRNTPRVGVRSSLLTWPTWTENYTSCNHGTTTGLIYLPSFLLPTSWHDNQCMYCRLLVLQILHYCWLYWLVDGWTRRIYVA